MDVIVQLTSGIIKVPFSLKWVGLSNTFSASWQNKKIPCLNEKKVFFSYFQFGDYPAACPVAASLQATSIFVSTLSITAIALDRRKLIVCPHEAPPSGTLIMTTVPIIWACAFAMASPLAIWKKLESWTEFPPEVMNAFRWVCSSQCENLRIFLPLRILREINFSELAYLNLQWLQFRIRGHEFSFWGIRVISRKICVAEKF